MPFPRHLVFYCPGSNGVEYGAHDDGEEGRGSRDGDAWVVYDPVPDEPGGVVDGFVGDVDFCACFDGLVETVFGAGCGTHVEECDYCVAGEFF